MRTGMLALAAVVLAAAPAAAQRTISPGMTEAQVRSVLGAPATTRATEGWTYLYYHNGCPVRCGSDDVVFLRDGRVVAAVFRTGARRFAGPAPDRALERAGGAEQRPAADGQEPAVVGRIRVGGEADDARGRTVISRPSEDGQGRTVIIREEGDDPAAPAPIRRSGSREAAAAPAGVRTRAPGDTALSDPPIRDEAERRARERSVTPNVIQNQPSPTDPERQRREEAVTPTVIRPQTPQDTVRPRQP